MRAVGELRAPWLTEVVRWLSRTVDVLVAVPALVVLVWLWRRRERSTALLLVVSAVTAPLLASQAKLWIQRPRPQVIEPLVTPDTLSFPSGHTMTAVGVYGFIAVVAWRRGRRGLRAVALASGAWVLVVGFARVYLGAHYPSDVLGSVLSGSATLVVVLLVDRWWVRRRVLVSAEVSE